MSMSVCGREGGLWGVYYFDLTTWAGDEATIEARAIEGLPCVNAGCVDKALQLESRRCDDSDPW